MSLMIPVFFRELRVFVFSPMAWVILGIFLLLNGVIFEQILLFLSNPYSPGLVQVMSLFFGNLFFWLLLLVLPPLLTMKSLSEEFREGTFETLMTTPLSEEALVLGKWLSWWSIFSFLWWITLTYPYFLSGMIPLDWGPIFSGYLGVLIFGAFFISMGVFTSSLTENSLVSALLSFALNLIYFSLAIWQEQLPISALKKGLDHFNIFRHMMDFKSGIILTQTLTLYFLLTAVFLFLTIRMVKGKRLGNL